MGAIVVIDADEESRHQAEDLEDSTGWTLWTFDPAEFGFDAFEEVSEAAAIVLDWDLGGYSAVDLVETLVRDPRTKQVPVVVVSATPTKSMVTTALRAGARGFAFKQHAKCDHQDQARKDEHQDVNKIAGHNVNHLDDRMIIAVSLLQLYPTVE